MIPLILCYVVMPEFVNEEDVNSNVQFLEEGLFVHYPVHI